MKKLSSIFILAMFIGFPMIVRADPVAITNEHGPEHIGNNETPGIYTTDILPEYKFETIYNTDESGVASAAYVKGAHNSAIRAVNKVAAVKQDVLSSEDGGNVSESGTGGFVTSIAAADGSVTVNKVEVSVPVQSFAPTISGEGRAAIWIQ